jgi:UDP-N-acetylglucosamine 4-epimerase
MKRSEKQNNYGRSWIYWSNLCEYFFIKGVCLDNFATGHRHNLKTLSIIFRLIEGDIRNAADCKMQ